MNKSIFGVLLGLIVLVSACKKEEEVIDPIVLNGVEMNDIEVGGPSEPNQVYIDFSGQNQTVVSRDSWDLGFYNGTTFNVVINNACKMLAYRIDKFDMTEVSNADTADLDKQLSLSAIFNALIQEEPPMWIAESTEWIDHPSGNLNETAIDAISSVDGENAVYIVNRGNTVEEEERGWKKVRIVQNGNGYTLQYADIDSPTFNTIDITKDPEYRYIHVNLDSGIVPVAPKAAEWDIVFTGGTEFYFHGFDVPYFFKSLVYQNLDDVTAQEIVLDENEDVLTYYNEFAFADVDDSAFSSAVNTIGPNWRNVKTPSPNSSNSVKTDRIYLVKDAEGSIFKVLFTKMLNEGGDRGYPGIKYQKLAE